MEAGKGRRRGDTKREATSEEVRQLREEVERLKGAQFDPRVAEPFLRVPETVWKELRAETERGS